MISFIKKLYTRINIFRRNPLLLNIRKLSENNKQYLFWNCLFPHKIANLVKTHSPDIIQYILILQKKWNAFYQAQSSYSSLSFLKNFLPRAELLFKSFFSEKLSTKRRAPIQVFLFWKTVFWNLMTYYILSIITKVLNNNQCNAPNF